MHRTAPGGSPALADIRYDYRNRMVEYRDLVSGQIHRYVYDAFGRRVSKTVDSTGVGNGPKETRYFYGGPGLQRVIEERDGATGEVIAAFVYGDGIDEPWVMFADPDDDNRYEEFYFLADDAGNVCEIRDHAGGPVEQYEYGDFGQPVDPVTLLPVTGNPSSIGNPYLFTGRRYDAETGLYWYRTRYFDPVAGRFTSRDTIGPWGDPFELGNAYAYVGNNPWTWVDPYGHGIVEAGWGMLPEGFHQWFGGGGHVPVLDPGPAQDATLIACDIVSSFGPGGPIKAVQGARRIRTITTAAAVTSGARKTRQISTATKVATGPRAKRIIKTAADEAAEKAAKQKRRFSKTDREEAFERSRDENGVPRCEYCQGEIDPNTGRPNSYEADHRHPYSKGGPSTPENLTPACRDCNRSKGGKALDEWITPGAGG